MVCFFYALPFPRHLYGEGTPGAGDALYANVSAVGFDYRLHDRKAYYFSG
jgi:hypothetical protein